MSEVLLAELAKKRVERDEAREELERVRADNCRLVDEREDWKKRAEALATALESAAQRMTVDRSHLIDERDAARAELERMRVECEGFRADLLRVTAERDNWQMEALGIQLVSTPVEDQLREAQERYAYLQAKATELQNENEKLRDACRTYGSDYVVQCDKISTLERECQASDAIIQGLRECLERTEKRLSQAKARQIPPALVGLLGVIRREAAAAEKMIL